jgi:hypothetical protein
MCTNTEKSGRVRPTARFTARFAHHMRLLETCTPFALVSWYGDFYLRPIGDREEFLQDDSIPLGISFISHRRLSPPLPQRQVLHPIRKVLRHTSVSNQFRVSHTLPNGHLELMGINNSGKRHTLLLPLGCFAEQVLVLTEQDATQSRRTIKQQGVGETSGTVRPCCQHVHSAQTQANRDRIRNVHVHI